MRLMVLLLVGMAGLTGCARHYAMTLTNGLMVDTSSKPKLVGSRYVYKNGSGQTVSVPQGQVLLIEPASMASKANSKFIPVGSQ